MEPGYIKASIGEAPVNLWHAKAQHGPAFTTRVVKLGTKRRQLVIPNLRGCLGMQNCHGTPNQCSLYVLLRDNVRQACANAVRRTNWTATTRQWVKEASRLGWLLGSADKRASPKGCPSEGGGEHRLPARWG